MFNPEIKFMHVAIEAALESRQLGDYAVGACIVRNDEVISKSGNRTHIDNDPTHHAEMIVIRDAAQVLGTKDLSGCHMYATHEPCAMCAGASVWARLDAVVSGAHIEDMTRYAENNANDDWKWRTINLPARDVFERGHPTVLFIPGFLRQDCIELFHS